VSRQLSRGRFVACLAFLLFLLAATTMPALAALTVVTAVWAALHAYELLWYREVRAHIRARTPTPAS
jgi:hypothetical protein